MKKTEKPETKAYNIIIYCTCTVPPMVLSSQNSNRKSYFVCRSVLSACCSGGRNSICVSSGWWARAPAVLVVLLVLWLAYKTLAFKIFERFCQTNYLNIYRTDLHQVCSFARTTAAAWMNDLLLDFRSFRGRCHGNQCYGRNRPAIHTFYSSSRAVHEISRDLGVRREVQLQTY